MRIRTNRIPSGYEELEYIQATGTQRIKLDIQPTSKYKIEETFAITDRSVTSCIWCARGNSTGTNSTTAFYIANSSVRCDYGTSAAMTNIGNINADQKYILTMDSEKWYLDGTLKTSMSAATFTAGSKLQLFCSHYNGQNANLGNYAKSKLYSFKVWDENRNLVCNLVPAKKSENSALGLYDLVSDTFYTNDGTGNFIAGPTKNFGSFRMSFSRFPVGFTKRTYIESTGTQYIDLDYVIKTNNVSIELDMMWTGTTVSAFESFVGFMYSPSTVTPRVGIHKYNSNLMFGANTTASSGTALMANERMIVKADFTSGSQKLYKNNSQIATSTTTYNFANNTCHTYVFARCCPNSENYAKMRLYECKIYEGTTLVRHYVPVVQDNNGELGLFELITRRFYVNGGTGTFQDGSATTPGEEYIQTGRVRATLLPKEYQEVEYIESSGSQYIDTLYIPNVNSAFEGKFMHTEHVVDTPLFGVRNSSYGNSYTFWAHPVEYTASGSNTMIFNGVQYKFPIGYNEGTIETFYVDKNVMKCNDQTYSYSASSGSPSLPLILFGLSNGGNIDGRKFIGKIYCFNIYENKVLVKKFVPCYRKNDNVVGMYDIINKTFYTNSGTGAFTKGSNKVTTI